MYVIFIQENLKIYKKFERAKDKSLTLDGLDIPLEIKKKAKLEFES